MDALVCFSSGIKVATDAIEDALEDALGEVGEVIGGGSGTSGSNVDLRIDDQVPPQEALSLIPTAWKNLNVPPLGIVMNGRDVDPL